MKLLTFKAALALLASLAAFAAHAAEGIGTIVLRPGHWQLQQQIWIEGKELLSALDEAAKRINDGIRADLAPADRAAFDRDVARRGSLNTEGDCISEADSRIDARTALMQALQTLHAAPWSCKFSDERASSSGIAWRYSCRTAAGAKADGSADFKVRNSQSYESTIEGMSHVIDNTTGAPLEPRILPVRSVAIGRWVAERCPAELEAESNSDDSHVPDEEAEQGDDDRPQQ